MSNALSQGQEPMTIGIVGCGNISDAYLRGAARSRMIRVKSVADIRPEAAAAKAAEYGVQAVGVDALLDDPEIALVLNLTIPAAHAPMDLRIVEAGKHAYSEKPLAVDLAEAEQMLLVAKARGVRVGCAPDTFLGAGHQACRRAIDAGRIGTPVAGAIAFLSHGSEHWHPNPEFFYKRGGGPVHDMGPYYITQLVNLLGPVARVSAEASIGNAWRSISSEPLAGQTIAVEVPTTVNGVLAFSSGANVAASLSWDVWRHGRPPIEIHGTEGSLLNPDPNFFGGTPQVTRRDGEWETLPIERHPFGVPTRKTRAGADVADYRIVGLLDMVAAIGTGRPHRASAELALHVLEVMDAFALSSREGRHVAIRSTCERPAPVPEGAGEEVFRG
ncbi:MAG: Gfo/Idh/MocA family oxidoreductase [Acetobacteraceae bacterium]|nr:Gfo/Idh/MocA family oxidoreductase [Acetobacteraceae bacterium]